MEKCHTLMRPQSFHGYLYAFSTAAALIIVINNNIFPDNSMKNDDDDVFFSFFSRSLPQNETALLMLIP